MHLVPRDKEGNVLNDGERSHVYEFRGDLARRLTLEDDGAPSVRGTLE